MLVTTRPLLVLGLTLAVALGAKPERVAHADNAKHACVAASTEGQTLRREDKLLAARDKLRVCAADPCPSIVKSHCNRWLSEIEAQIPTAIVRARDAHGGDVFTAQVAIDGNESALGRPETLDPGEHVATVKGANGISVEKKFLLVDGEKGRVITVDLGGLVPTTNGDAATSAVPVTSEPSSRSSAIPLGAWVLGGVSIVAFGTSIAFAVVTSNDLNGLRQTCAPYCTDSDTSNGRTHALITDVSLGVGIAGAAGAVAWAIFGRSSGATKTAVTGPSLDVRPLPGGALGTVALRF